jgi:tetratricopeptide (TPR) repeat protein
MSLTTVAAPIQPDPILAQLPPSRPERFLRSDFVAAGIVFLVTLSVYVATLAPTVTLEDSGELITAAAKFGCGHPPGYPFWTMSGFLLSHIFPFGSLAYRINLLCAIFGGLSNAVLTLLACHSGRWLLQRWTTFETQAAVKPYVFYIGLFAGLVIGFSDVMWSQAVISAVHGTLNALFVNLVLLFFYLWMIEPQKTHRLVFAVFIFALGLTNHHTLVQVIPAFLLGALLLRRGYFWSVFVAVNLFSLSLLVYISWLSGDNDLQTISQSMAWLVFGLTAAVSFFYLKEFRLKLFLLGALTAAAVFAVGFYLMSGSEDDTQRYVFTLAHWWQTGAYTHPGWLQGVVANAHAGLVQGPRELRPNYLLSMLGLAAVAIGLLYSSSLDRRMIIAVFAVGWVGLTPYAYLPTASQTDPPMNWGVPSERSGFYYSVSREQYPKSLPTLIKSTFGKVLGVIPKDAQLDATIGLPDYYGRLGKTFYYYGDNLTQNFTAPLIFLTLAILFFIQRCDRPQINWLIFLGAAFFLLGFMLLLIAPPEGFDLEQIMQYKVFHLQSHCIFVLMMSYGALALITYLHDLVPEVPARTGVIGFGVPALFLSLLPLWSNFDDCSQAGHWFGYYYGADMMRDMDKNAVYFGGTDPGRFVPTFMAFVESQQPDQWKADWTVYPELAKKNGGFDRRDITVLTQNALCDTYYAKYIRDQYDARFRPKTWTPFEKWLGRDTAYPKTPVELISEDELVQCWEDYKKWPGVAERIKQLGLNYVTRPGTNDVFEINGIVLQKIFEKDKKDHTFYLEQSVPISWTYPYLQPWGLIFRMSNDPMKEIPQAVIAQDHQFWDAYSQKLLTDPHFRFDPHAMLTFAKLAYWHADLYRWRALPKEQEYWLKLSLKLCPQLQDAARSLVDLYVNQQRYDEAVSVVQQGQEDDPRNEGYGRLLIWVQEMKINAEKESELRGELAKNPYDVQLNLSLAKVFQDEGKYPELDDRLRMAAGLTNWARQDMADVVRYYVDTVNNKDAAIAFLEARAKIDPNASELIYSLAALHATAGHRTEALRYLEQAISVGGTNAASSARIDPRFVPFQNDPDFQALLDPNAPVAKPGEKTAPTGKSPATNAPPKPVKK